MKLSDRIRPDVEAAPWVIEEVKKLEAEVALLKNHYSLDAASKLRAEVAAARSLTALREHERDEARAEVERLRADLSYAERERDRWMGQVVAVAERQREACAQAVDRLVAMVQAGAGESTLGQRIEQAARAVRATPLVTGGDK